MPKITIEVTETVYSLLEVLAKFTFRLNVGNVSRHTLERLDSFVVAVVGKHLTENRSHDQKLQGRIELQPPPAVVMAPQPKAKRKLVRESNGHGFDVQRR